MSHWLSGILQQGDLTETLVMQITSNNNRSSQVVEQVSSCSVRQ